MLDKDSIYVLRFLAFALWALATIAAAWFRFRETGQTLTQKEITRARYRRMWEMIRETGLNQLPETLIGWMLRQKTRPGKPPWNPGARCRASDLALRFLQHD